MSQKFTSLHTPTCISFKQAVKLFLVIVVFMDMWFSLQRGEYRSLGARPFDCFTTSGGCTKTKEVLDSTNTHICHQTLAITKKNFTLRHVPNWERFANQLHFRSSSCSYSMNFQIDLQNISLHGFYLPTHLIQMIQYMSVQHHTPDLPIKRP